MPSNAPEAPDRCVPALFGEQARRTPDCIAVKLGEQRLTYRELDARSDALARSLKAHGVGPEILVGLCMDRSPDLVVGMLAVLKAGGAYLPLDPLYPEERLRFMVDDAKPRAILTRRALEPRLRNLAPAVPLLALDADEETPTAHAPPLDLDCIAPHHLAYVIYTSGSTGKPKGVLVEHKGLPNLVREQVAAFAITRESRVLQFASPAFDASVSEVFTTLLAGATLVLAPRHALIPGPAFVRLLREERVSVVTLPPSVLAALPEDDLPDLRTLVVAGEACPAPLATKWARGRRFVNAYGPTEATVCATLAVDAADGGTPPIGLPLANARVALVAEDGRRVTAAGEIGEIHIGGIGLARGYLGRPELTAERFVTHPAFPGERLYRTGDLARYRPDGLLEFLGRADHQVKIRGHRIELGEVEAALLSHPCVREAVATAREDTPGEKRLVAYVVTDSEGALSASELREHVATRLPEAFVPSAFVRLSSFPLTPNLKVDRNALPAPETARPELRQEYVAPRTPTETLLARTWATVLGLDRVGVHDDFFELGGHSLLATQAATRASEGLGVTVPLTLLFEAPTVAALAARLAEQPEAPKRMPLAPASRTGPIPLTFAQDMAYFMQQIAPDSGAYQAQALIHLQGDLDVSVLERAITEIIRRHEMLRTTFPLEEGRPTQRVHPPWAPRIPHVDLRGVPENERRAALDRHVAEQLATPFDLTTLPLARWTLYRTGDREHALLHQEHHLIHDGWTFNVFLRELLTLYDAFLQGRPSPLPEPPVQFADFALWQRRWMETAEAREQLAYWRGHLEGAPATLALPTDKPRPAVKSYRGITLRSEIPAEAAERLRALARRSGTTLFMTLLAGFGAFLKRYTGSDDLVVGTSVANRRSPEAETLLGMIVNTLALRLDASGDPSFQTFLARVRAETLGGYANQDLPFERLVDELKPERNLSHNPIFQVAFHFHDAPVPHLRAGGLRVEPEEALGNGSSKFDLNVIVIPRAEQRVVHGRGGAPGGLTLVWEGSSDLFEHATLERMIAHFVTLLHGVAEAPETPLSRLPLLAPQEHLDVTETWSAGARVERPPACLHHLFEQQAAATPDRPAVTFEGAHLTYRELDHRANRLAHRLAELGVGPDVLVGLHLERSADLIAAILGVWKAGGAYLPLDPDLPEERLRFMIEDARPRVVVTTAALAARLPAGASTLILDAGSPEAASPPPRAVAPTHLAYVIYTSGSTGRPKGVAVEHGGVVNRLLWMRDRFPLRETDAMLQKTPFSFDVSVWEILWPLICGARLVVARPGGHKDPQYLADLLRAERVTQAHFVPSMLHGFIDAGALDNLPGLERVFCSGEALTRDLQDRFFARSRAELHNLYGPTEASIEVTHWQCEPGSPRPTVPLGRPLPNVRTLVLDPQGNPSPIGVPGELYLGGACLARGYLNRPELTAERFVPSSLAPEERLYRTGDLARWAPDGTLEFLGRIDHQVKVRGFRIELGEIEQALREHPRITDAVVVARNDGGREARLVAYVVGGVDAADLRAHLKRTLPEYMVPSLFVPLAALPFTPSGKVDRKALPAPDLQRLDATRSYVAPRTPAEEALAALWAQVLRVERVGVHDNFFDLGGDSILSIQVVARAREKGLRLSPRDVFLHQTLEALAAVATPENPVANSQQSAHGDVPLTPIQRWFFSLDLPERHHFNQARLLHARADVRADLLEEALRHVVAHHDALRATFARDGDGTWRMTVPEPGNAHVALDRLDLAGKPEVWPDAMGRLHASLDLSQGPLLRAALVDLGSERGLRIFLTTHHLVVDAVSWSILLEDLHTAYVALSEGQPVRLPSKTTPFREWAQHLAADAMSAATQEELAYWVGAARKAAPLPRDRDSLGSLTHATVRTLSVTLPAEETRALLQEVPKAYRARVNDALLAGLAQALSRWTGERTVLVDLEGHGREETGSLDLSRTIGWFTTLYPVSLALPTSGTPGDVLKSVKEQLRAVPRNGLGYGLLRHLSGNETARRLAALPQPEVTFNYLGQTDTFHLPSGLFAPAAEAVGTTRSPAGVRSHLLDIQCAVRNGALRVDLHYSETIHERETMQRLAESFIEALRDLVAHCRDPRAGGCTPSDFPLAGLDQETLDRLLTPIGPRAVEDIYPLSPLQQGMHFHTLLEPGSGVYHEQLEATLHAALDAERFAQAWAHLAARHPPLRTSFHWDGLREPLQIVHRAATIPVRLLDWSAVDAEDLDGRFAALLEEDRNRGFTLHLAPLARLTLVRLPDGRHRLLWSFHHLALDGWSALGLLHEALLPATGSPQAEAAPRPYRDFIAWLRRQDPTLAEQHWRKTLRGFRTPTPLPLADAGPTHPTTSARAEVRVEIDKATTTRLRSLAKDHRLTLNTLLQGAWGLLLGKTTGEEDVVFGATVSGRPPDLPGVEQMIGLFINTVPVRVSLPPEAPLVPWLQGLQEAQAAAREVEHSSLVQVQECSDVPRGTRLFETLLVFESYPRESLEGVTGLQIHERTNYPLTLIARPGERLHLRLAYDSTLYPPERAGALLGHLQTILECFAQDPDAPLGERTLLTTSERAQVVEQGTGTTAPYPRDACIHTLFEEQVRLAPDRVAFTSPEGDITYAELDARASKLARKLRALGVGPDVLVGVLAERSPDLLIAILATLKAGGAYLPLDPAYPEARVRFMLEDARPRVVLAEEPLAARLPTTGAAVVVLAADDVVAEDAPPAAAPTAESLAYVMYTSGSTGTPKGVEVTHRGVVRLVKGQTYARFGPEEVFLQLAPAAFDASTLEIWGALLNGGRLVLPPPGPLSLAALGETIRQHGVTTLWLTAPLFHAMIDENPEGLRGVRQLLAGGDALSPAHVEKALRLLPETRIINGYGPTENTTFTCCHVFDPQAPVGARAPIGRPIANTRVHVLDARRNPVPVGVPGELYAGGDGLARGYLNRPDLTAERFVPDPLQRGERLYRTGDLVRWLPDGNLEFLGRIDHQVKIRGHRVEPGEVEAALASTPGVREAAVVARDDGALGKRLAAFYVPANGPLPVPELREHLKRSLPEPLIPSTFTPVDALPLTPNGKVDRKALQATPEAVTAPAASGAQYVAPREPLEEILATIWEEILQVPRVRVHDDFFQLGGHSLRATQVISRVRAALGVDVPLRAIFDAPTVAGLAAHVMAILVEDLSAEAPPGEVAHD